VAPTIGTRPAASLAHFPETLALLSPARADLVHALGDALIAAAYVTIGIALFHLVRHRDRPGLLHPGVFLLFAIFIALSGVVHALTLLETWLPVEGWSGAFKLLTALVSVAAAVALVRVVPSILQMPSRAQLRQQNATLEDRVAARTADLTEINTRLLREIAQREVAENEVRRLNTELQARLAELESLFKILPVGVAISTDANCRQLRSNQAFADLVGTTVRAPSVNGLPFEPPESFHVTHDGRELRPHELPMHRAIITNSAVRDFDATITRADGVTIEVIANAVPIRDDEGRPRGCVATYQDITAHKHAERKRLDFERKLLQSQKLESIGVLAGGIAHDFNNLLTGVLGHANFARSELARGSSQIDHLLAQVELAAQRAAELCRQLLAYAGKGRFVVRLIDLNVAVEQAVLLLKLSISKKVTLDLQLGAGLPPFRGDPTQFNQVLMNLVTNASEAIGSGVGTVTIRTERVTLAAMDMLTLTSSHEVEPGAFVCLEVKDTGCGIPPESIGHIFEPFFTTKFVGRGLGLAAVLGIVQGHRGAIRVSSQVGVGTTFELFFPVASAPVRETAPGFATPAPAARGSVLVVDDEPAVRNLASTALAAAGFVVSTAVDGEDALVQLRRDPLQFDAVLLDLTMPKLDGEDTLMALRMLAPNLPVVLTSGHSEHVAQRFVGRGLADFLAKPFVSESLVNAIQTAIARARSTVG
jgi:PAS domain S-box-containing protein